MRNRSHPVLAVALGLVASLVAYPAESAGDRDPDMDAARAAQQALAPVVPGGPRAVDVTIASPGDGAIFSDEPVAHLWGRLEALARTGPVDAVIVIDTSRSTERTAQRPDRVKLRIRGKNPWQASPSILDHEIRSIEMLMEDLNPRTTRIGIVSFAGSEEGAPYDRKKSARTEVPITGRLERVDAGLQRLLKRGAAGRTDMASGLDLAVRELAGRGRSEPRAGAAKVVVFFTDGMPTLPHDRVSRNEPVVAAAAARASRAGVRVFSFAIGPEALSRPTAAVQIAERTDGVFTPVRRPADLADAVRATVEFKGVGGRLMVRNASTQENASDLQLGPNGVFGGVIPLRPGKNRIHVRATAGGHSAEVWRQVHYAPGTVSVFKSAFRSFLPVDRPTTRRELELGRSQQRELELTVGDAQRKEIEIGVGDAPAAPSRSR
jgi:hypothetical protein